MQVIISGLSGLVIIQMLFGVLYAQMQLDRSAFSLLFTAPDTVSATLLSFGTWIQVAALGFTILFLRHTSPQLFLFPRFLIGGLNEGPLETGPLTLIWERFSAMIVLGLPIVGAVYWWIVFLEDDKAAWIKATNEVVGRFEYVPGCHFFDKGDMCRFGSIPPSLEKGDSFVPLWQPLLIMGGGTFVMLALTIRVLALVRQRAPIRRAAVELSSGEW